MASASISELNNRLLDVQTDYAISIVDDFFSGKIAAVSMYENDSMFNDYFASVKTKEDIETYEGKAVLLNELSDVLNRTSDEKVLQVWIVDVKTDSYLFSTGVTGDVDMEEKEWYRMALEQRKPVVSDPYLDSYSGQSVVSVVTPVFSGDGAQINGFMGLDVSMNSLSELLSEIKVGEKGYMELLSNSSVYIYSNDPTSINKNVDELDISEEYKKNVQDNYNGVYDFTYMGVGYTSIFRNSQTTSWLAIATLPLSEMNATRNHLMLLMAVLSILILCILIVVIVSIVRKMMRPLADISTNMEQFARGSLDVVPAAIWRQR